METDTCEGNENGTNEEIDYEPAQDNLNEIGRDPTETESNTISYMVSTDDYEEGETIDKKEESLEFRDELDFEEGERESGDDSIVEDKPIEEEEILNKEDGELSEEEEDEAALRQEPKTVCRFFNKGQCTWGTNCRFLHPGVSDKGNYNMFAPNKGSAVETDEPIVEKDRIEEPRDLARPEIQEQSQFESAWERGLRHAKEMMKRANKRKETDADFEEKRFNLSLGQAELDRENDYYTRQASPVYKPVDVDYLDPYEKQAIRHFRGGHFENIEVRYNVDANYPRGGGHIRSRRDKFEREVTERIPRRRDPSPPAAEHRVNKEKRYPRPKGWQGEKAPLVDGENVPKQEAETWADPWARRSTPADKKKSKSSRPRRSYSTGSSSRSSRSSRSSSYSSYSRSSSSRSGSSSRSITPPIHPRQRAVPSRGGGRGARTSERVGMYKPRMAPVPGPAPSSKGPRRNEATNDNLKPQMAKKIGAKVPKQNNLERVDMFGRTIRKDLPPNSPRGRPISRSPNRARDRKYSYSSRSSLSSRSRSKSSSSRSSSRSPMPKKRERVKMTQGTVTYGDSIKSKSTDLTKLTGQKQAIKLSLKKSTQLKTSRPVINIDEDSGESDVDARILKKRKGEPSEEERPAKVSRKQAPSSSNMMAILARKPVGLRDELLKQLKAVEDAIAKKRVKP